MGFFWSALRLLTLLRCIQYPTVLGEATTDSISVKSHLNQHGTSMFTTDDRTYTVDITLGGQNFTVLIDTGSTDLWVNSKGLELLLTNTTDLTIAEDHERGQVQGTLQFAELKVGDYVVPSQAFINATKLTDLDHNVDGMLGLSLDNSNIFNTIESLWGASSAIVLRRSFINNLLAENPFLPSNFNVQMRRRYVQGDDSLITNVEGTPFIQPLSTQNPSALHAELVTERGNTLASLPPTPHPAKFIRRTNSNTVSPGRAVTVRAVAEDGIDGMISDKTFKIVALSLLGANLLVGLALLGITVTMCVRGPKGRSAGRSSGSQYAPAKYVRALKSRVAGGRSPSSGKFKNIEEHDTESGALWYSD